LNVEAIFPALRLGSRVRRAVWHPGYVRQVGQRFYFSDGSNATERTMTWFGSDLVADDWEVVEEPIAANEPGAAK
jgi:hypothetical protein